MEMGQNLSIILGIIKNTTVNNTPYVKNGKVVEYTVIKDCVIVVKE